MISAEAEARDRWRRGVDGVAALLTAPIWARARAAAMLRELGRPTPASWTEREAVVIDDRFALFEVLAAGSRSTVFAGVDLATGIEAAVKVLLPTPGLAAHRRELARELEILTRLRHYAIVELLAHGRCGALPYLATRRLAGGPLHAWLAAQPSLDRRLRVIRDAALGLAAAAAMGLAHGDLKPPNLLVSADDHGCLCDWGSARLSGGWGSARLSGGWGSARLSVWDDLLPRPTTSLFCPPERRSRPHEPTPAGDVFSLGLCLAFAVRGDHQAPSETERADPQAWLELATAGLEPTWLAELVGACLAADPRRRPTPTAIARALAQGTDVGAAGRCDILREFGAEEVP